MKPNIFTIATKELSQDGFFTWLLQWADSSNAQYDSELNAAAADLVRHLVELQFPENNLVVEKVTTFRQWYNIDILVEVNDDLAIIIEDKVDTAEHSDQLERYKKIATEYYSEKNRTLVFIYLKTGNESSYTLSKVRNKGFAVVTRKAVLDIFNKRQVSNDIFTAFKEHLVQIEEQTNSFGTLQRITSDWKAAEGFFMALQERLNAGDWGYVSNQTGGFLGFWYYWNGTTQYSLYIQVENCFENGIKLVVKIGDWEPDISTLYYILERLQQSALSYGITLIKPNRYRAGETSTVAIVVNAFPVDSDSRFDMDKFVANLRLLEKAIDDYSRVERNKLSERAATTGNA